MKIIIIPARSDNYIYLAHDTASGQTAVVDPAEAEPVLAVLQQNNWQLHTIFNTHHHDDHIHGNFVLKQQTGAKIVAARADQYRIPDIDIAVKHGDSIQLGSTNWQIIATPGHTLNHIVFYSADKQILFTGDTLFSLGCGRLFEGSAEQMWQSLQLLKKLPLNTQVYCAHEYTLANARFALSVEADNQDLIARINTIKALRDQNLATLPTTIEQELATNPFFRENSLRIRKTLGLNTDEPDVKVFARIRQLKDQFS